MSFTLLFGAISLLLLISLFWEYRKMLYFQGNIILWTILPSHGKEDPQVLHIIRQGRKGLWIATGLGMILLIGYPFIKEEFQVFYFLFNTLMLFLLFFFPLQRALKKMRLLKETRQWRTSSSYQVTVDTKLSVLGEKMVFSSQWFLIPIGIILLTTGWAYMQSDRLILPVSLWLGGIIILSNGILLQIYRKAPNRIYSSREEDNLRILEILKYKVIRQIFYFSIGESLLFMFFIVIYSKDIYNLHGVLFFILGILLLSMGNYLFIQKRETEIYHLMEIEYMDQDIYYDLWGYKNPRDPRILVPSLTGGKSRINRGILPGKILLTLMALIVLGSLLIVSFPYLSYSDSYGITLTQSSLELRGFPYKDQLPLENIERVKLVQSFPKGRWIRENGVSMGYFSYGHFRIEGIGPVKFYLYQSLPFIEIERRGESPIYLNFKSPKATEEFYQRLQEILAQ